MTKTNADQPSLTKPPQYQPFAFWIVGDTPLITHAWSHKAKQEMLAKQTKAVKPGREAKSPEENFHNSLYVISDNPPVYGFPAMAVKNAILSAAHKDKGVPKTAVQSALYIRAPFVRTRPALSSAICDMPLLRIYGSHPEMREDMVRVGAGLNKSADLAYRAQFTVWAMRVIGMLNIDVLPVEQLGYLTTDAGMSAGIGDWRNEKHGFFGAFHPATPSESDAWELFANGRGPMPESSLDVAA